VASEEFGEGRAEGETVDGGEEEERYTVLKKMLEIGRESGGGQYGFPSLLTLI